MQAFGVGQRMLGQESWVEWSRIRQLGFWTPLTPHPMQRAQPEEGHGRPSTMLSARTKGTAEKVSQWRGDDRSPA